MNLIRIALISVCLMHVNLGYAKEGLQHFDDEIINDLKDMIIDNLAEGGSRSFSKGDLVFIGNYEANDSVKNEYKNYYLNLKKVGWEVAKEKNAPTRILTEGWIESKNNQFLDRLEYITSCKSDAGKESIYSYEIQHPKVIYNYKTVNKALISPNLKNHVIDMFLPSVLGLICATSELQNAKNDLKRAEDESVKIKLEKY